jgi:hypothetical protein
MISGLQDQSLPGSPLPQSAWGRGQLMSCNRSRSSLGWTQVQSQNDRHSKRSISWGHKGAEYNNHRWWYVGLDITAPSEDQDCPTGITGLLVAQGLAKVRDNSLISSTTLTDLQVGQHSAFRL